MAIKKNQFTNPSSVNYFLIYFLSTFFMKKFLAFFPLSFMFVVLFSCQPGGSAISSSTDSAGSKPTVENPANNIPEMRAQVKKEPVDLYKEKTDNPINDWYFSVKLFETPETFHYVIKMQFEELTADDTLKLPNFGTMPKPVLKKGDARYSCVIGFMDNENKFREYKLVHVEGNELKITTLKHYAVATYQK
jgi:hypothetical protein